MNFGVLLNHAVRVLDHTRVNRDSGPPSNSPDFFLWYFIEAPVPVPVPVPYTEQSQCGHTR